MLMLHQGMTVTEVAKMLCAVRWPVGDILNILPLLVRRSPQDFGWLRSRWSTELLTLIVNRFFNVTLHSSTLHRYLKQAGIVWR
jgi:putative transposase